VPPGAGGGLRGAIRQRWLATSERPPQPPRPHWVGVTIWALGLTTALLLWFLVYAFALSGLQEAHSQHDLYAALRSELAEQTAPPLRGTRTPSDSYPVGTPVAQLQVPQAGISAVVVEGTTAGALEQGPGLSADTPMPGQPGTSLILGRQALFGGPFRNLAALHRGDLIRVTTGQGRFTYVVSDLRYPGDRLPQPLRAGQSRLTLASITGPGWRSFAPDQLIYVDATLRGKTVAFPGGTATSLPSSETIMHGNPGVGYPLSLWLILLGLVVAAVAWVRFRMRWGGWQTWLVSVPVILAVLYVVSDTAVQLLPNLL
jgi:LPXTG-site transpeptidase (sortase) family protein